MTDIFIVDPREESRGRDYIKKTVNRALIDAGLSLDAKVYAGRSVGEIRSSNGLASGGDEGSGGPQNAGWINYQKKKPKELECYLCVNEFGGMWVDQYRGGSFDEEPIYYTELPENPVG